MYQFSSSKDAHPEELNLFNTPATETAYEKIQWVDYAPVSQLKEGAPVEFVIPPSGSQYINLKQTYLQVKIKVVKGDGTELKIEDQVAPVNLIMHSLWNQIDCMVQQKLISPSTNNYHYRAMIETLLSYDSNAKGTQLQAEGYYKDTAVAIDASDPSKGGNKGLNMRLDLVSKSKEAEFMGPLHLDLFQQDRLLLNGVEVRLKLWPAHSHFALMTHVKDASYKLILTEASLKVCKISLNPSLSLAQAELLSKSPAQYPFERTDVKTFNIPSGSFTFRTEDLYQGAVPSRLILGLVKSEAYNGSFVLNPYNFIHADCNCVSVCLDDESVPAHPLRPRFDKFNFIEAYNTLFRALNKDGQDVGNDITLGDYAKGYTLYAFDLLPTTSTISGVLNQFPIIRRGNLRLDLTFNKALPSNVTLLALGKFPSMLTIDHTRNIVL